MSRVAETDIPEYVDRFFREHGPGRMRLLAMTYQFTPEVFEARFERLFRRGAVRVDVLSGDESTTPRRESYRIWRANWPGTFHPKLLVMLANDRIAVGLGSANLTAGGLGGNLECWQFVEDGLVGQPLLAGVRKLLQAMQTGSVTSRYLDIDELVSALPSPSSGTIVSTLFGSLLNQVADRVKHPVKRLDILSPLNCDPGIVLKKIIATTAAAEVHLYTSRTVPIIPGCDSYWNLTPPRSSDEDEKISNFSSMHAKMYAFWNAGHVDLFWGSANLSQSAWVRTGRTANVDLLVHSRLAQKQWTQLRDHLPGKHYWKEVKPVTGINLDTEVSSKAEEWRILHAFWDGRTLLLEASQSGPILLWLRQPNGVSVRVSLDFRERQARVQASHVRRLGIGDGPDPPDGLEVAMHPSGPWRPLWLNVSDRVTGGHGLSDAVTWLFWQYTGRFLPGSDHGSTTMGGPSSEVPRFDGDSEEEELTRSLHQGELDRFVLQWRLTARRIAACSGQNSELLRRRVNEAIRLIRSEAEERPGAWPGNRLAFVERLLDTVCQGRI